MKTSTICAILALASLGATGSACMMMGGMNGGMMGGGMMGGNSYQMGNPYMMNYTARANSTMWTFYNNTYYPGYGMMGGMMGGGMMGGYGMMYPMMGYGYTNTNMNSSPTSTMPMNR